MMGGSQRLTMRQAEAQDRRNQMTRRRHEMSNKIRKEKKSQYLLTKRKILTTSTTTGTMTTNEAGAITKISTLIQKFSQNPEELQALEQALRNSCDVSKSRTQDNPLVFLSQDQASVAASVMNQLLQILQSRSGDDGARLLALHTMVHLTAISTTPSTVVGAQDNYYQQSPETWCTSLLRTPGLLRLIVSTATQIEAACVILGNLAGDPSHEIRLALHQAGMVQALVSSLRQQLRQETTHSTTSLAGAATWALTNAIRQDTTSWAKTYCSEDLLSPALLEQLLLLEGRPGDHSSIIASSTQQVAWMIASLTSRESDIVDYLCSHGSFCGTLVKALESTSLMSGVQGGHEDPRLPLIQALGHIASCAVHVPTLLSLNLAPLVGHILQQRNIRGPVFAQTAWLAGCLLCDAGVANHPSTNIAAPILIPLLVELLSPETGSLLLLDERREVICALWNAVADPPSSDDYLPDYGGNNTIPARAATTIQVTLPTTGQALCKILPVLVDLICSLDADATVAAVHVLNILLRREGAENTILRTAFEEAMGVEALEKLCDSSLHEAAAEIAADLLDDLFLIEGGNDETGMGTFGEGLPRDAPTFGGVFGREGYDGNNSVEEAVPQIVGVSGRGRGRGSTLPSWMAQP